LLMEAHSEEQRAAVRGQLTIAEVDETAKKWAVERQRRSVEPALAIFCPVKCKAYFSDNGGRNDSSNELKARFLDLYQGTIKGIRDNAPNASILYAPVDTLGCVELLSAKWGGSPETGDLVLATDYRIRGDDPKISRLGAADVMRALCRHLTQAKQALSEALIEDLESQARTVMLDAVRKEGFFRNLWHVISGERAQQRRAAAGYARQANEERQRVVALSDVLTTIAATPYGLRTHEL
jgi:hypothetical protein